MPDDPTPEPQAEPAKHFVVRIAQQGDLFLYVVCEAIVSFDESNFFPEGANALEHIYRQFHDEEVAGVAVLPPLSDTVWKHIGATGQLAQPGHPPPPPEGDP